MKTFLFYKSSDNLHNLIDGDSIPEAIDPGTDMAYGDEWEKYYYAVPMKEILENSAQGDTRMLANLIMEYPKEVVQALRDMEE